MAAAPAVADEKRLLSVVERLEKRVIDLEARLAEAERRAARDEQRAAPTRTARRAQVQPVERSVSEPDGGRASGGAPASPVETIVARDTAPAEFNVFRENAATLERNRFEAAIGFAYTKKNSDLQSDRGFGSFLNLRYGVWDGIELSVNVPYYRTTRQTQIGPVITRDGEVSSFGDIQAQVNAILFRETADLPGVVAIAGAILPTGASRYNFDGFQLGFSPFDPFEARESRGHWGAIGGLQVYKTIDPIIVFFGAGAEYLFPKTISGFEVKPAIRFTYNAGFSFAVSEKTTLGFSVIGAFQRATEISGAIAPFTGNETIVARLVAIQRVAKDTFIEPSVGIGLTRDAPDAVLGVTLRRRF